MHNPAAFSAVAAALLSSIPAVHAGLYPKSSPVLQVEAKDYDRLVAKSNYTTILEFYAPWCGHCQNLKPAYEKAARNLDGLAHVAAINCDDDSNKPLCSTMGIQGFPTLKIARPGKTAGKPVVEDYNGPRSATGIVEAVVDRINNHVKRLTDKDLDSFLETDAPKALLFTEKGTTSALIKGIAIDFLDVIKVGQVRNKEVKAVEKFAVDKFPTLVLVPGGDKQPIVYDGEMKKKPMVEFLSQAGSPNPEFASAPAKSKKAAASSSKSTKSKATTASEDAGSSTTDAKTTETVKAPVIVESAIPIPTIHTADKLLKECLNEKAHTCVLALVPEGENEKADNALKSLADLAYKHAKSNRKLFPIYAVPTSGNTAVTSLLKSLDLTGEVELVAINARRGWWRHFEGGDFGHQSIESWIDAIRMSEGVKKKLPEGLIAIAVENHSSDASPEAKSEATPTATESASAAESSAPATPEPSSESSSDATESAPTKGAGPTAEAETGHKHEEL